VSWTTPADVIEALGESAAPDPADPWLTKCCEAASVAAHRKRAAAGYVDPPATDPAPSADVAMGATLWAQALWRERVAVDGFTSFEDLAGYMPTGGTWGTIRRLLGIGRAQTDAAPDLLEPVPVDRRRRDRRIRALRYGARSW